MARKLGTLLNKNAPVAQAFKQQKKKSVYRPAIISVSQQQPLRQKQIS